MKKERLNIGVNVDPLNKLKSDYSTVESHVVIKVPSRQVTSRESVLETPLS